MSGLETALILLVMVLTSAVFLIWKVSLRREQVIRDIGATAVSIQRDMADVLDQVVLLFEDMKRTDPHEKISWRSAVSH